MQACSCIELSRKWLMREQVPVEEMTMRCSFWWTKGTLFWASSLWVRPALKVNSGIKPLVFHQGQAEVPQMYLAWKRVRLDSRVWPDAVPIRSAVSDDEAFGLNIYPKRSMWVSRSSLLGNAVPSGELSTKYPSCSSCAIQQYWSFTVGYMSWFLFWWLLIVSHHLPSHPVHNQQNAFLHSIEPIKVLLVSRLRDNHAIHRIDAGVRLPIPGYNLFIITKVR